MTTGNWDFSQTIWELDSVRYTSTPSSLRTHITGVIVTDFIVLVKTSVVPIANVKEGKVITQYRQEAGVGILDVIFRYQDTSNYYFVKFYPYTYFGHYALKCQCWKRVAGVNTKILSDVPTTFVIDSNWTNLRVTWWNDAVGLVIRAEYYDGANWILLYDFYDALNLWNSIGGRVGFKLYGQTLYHCNVDDTYIYGT